VGEYAAVCCCGEEPPTCECDTATDWLRLSVFYQGRRSSQVYNETCEGPGTCIISDMPRITASGDLRTNYIETTFWLKCENTQSVGQAFVHNSQTADAEHPTTLDVSEIWRNTYHRLNKDRTGCDGGVCYAYDFAHYLGGTQRTIDSNSPDPAYPNERPGIDARTYIISPIGGVIYFDERILEGIRVTIPDFEPDPSKHYRILEVQIFPVCPFPVNVVAQTYIGCDFFSSQNDFYGNGPEEVTGLYGVVGCSSQAVSNITEVYELEECDVYEQGERIWKGVQNYIGFPPDCFDSSSPIYTALPFQYEENDPPDPPTYCGFLPSCCGFGGPGATVTGTTSSDVYEINAGVTSWQIEN